MKHLLSMVLLMTFSTLTGQGQGLQVGDPAPDFSLPYATKDSVADEPLKFSALVGKRAVLLAFYPADWSGGCTKEVCSFRDDFGALTNGNVEILGISGDYEYSHREWAQHHNLPFKLLADHDHAVAKRYQSYNETTGFNRRTVYLVDAKGKIAYIDLQYSTRDASSFEKLKSALTKMN
jgi:peroxiredoxin Q/BCP